ncbi:hypothetical protein ASG25_03095 [Rhizobium sp. Leaf384]|uniref:hypothetical protein n=1 Tax=unclassified Rhizobium TaxID=2613769 RepID=UPI000714CBA3|nr:MULTISPECIES: hypothetical protein [unclassified Rhizobium]KQS80578.1 hypothetical protein ASG25_03095 [Rhizobium sp. Leaf384]KQS82516.1 hypothetical protein ASG58_03910 [Rhizobium sp. Leaf383]
MSLRFKSLSATFGISIALWAVLIQGGLALYQTATSGSLSESAMMGSAAKSPDGPSDAAHF